LVTGGGGREKDIGSRRSLLSGGLRRNGGRKTFVGEKINKGRGGGRSKGKGEGDYS